VGTQHLCPASSRGGLPGLAATPRRVPQRWGTTSCREAAPLTPHAQPGTPAVGYHQLSRGSSTYTILPAGFPSGGVPPAVERGSSTYLHPAATQGVIAMNMGKGETVVGVGIISGGAAFMASQVRFCRLPGFPPSDILRMNKLFILTHSEKPLTFRCKFRVTISFRY
jgi:hypothetical protein